MIKRIFALCTVVCLLTVGKSGIVQADVETFREPITFPTDEIHFDVAKQ